MKNILFLADPNSIHDIKWISYFARKNARCFLIPRIQHLEQFKGSPQRQSILEQSGFQLLQPIHDFSMARFYRTLYEAYAIRKIIIEKRIDVVHILYAEPNALWCLFRSFFSVPMIVTTRGTDVLVTIPSFFKRSGLLNWIVANAYRKAFRLADRVTVTSRSQIESIKEFARIEDDLELIRTGVDVAHITSNMNGSIPLHNSSAFILFPRYVKPIYNHEFSVRAIALLPPHIKTKYTMVFLGKGTGDLRYQEELENLMRAQPDVRFEFLERQDQETLFALYRHAEVVVMCPVSDGSPVSGMEALICGAKLILGPLDYDTEIFSRAIRMRAWDPEELAYLIVQALEGEGRPQLSAEEIALMDRETNMKRMWAIYQSVIDSGQTYKMITDERDL